MSYSDIFETMSINNPVFKTYLFCNGILILKMLGVAVLTGWIRSKKHVVASPEDVGYMKGGKFGVPDPDIERVRRAHLNDLENIPIYFVAAYGYIVTNPNPLIAIWLMRSFTIARIAHTIVYAVFVVPQPARAIAFLVGFSITCYMAVVSVVSFVG